MRMSSALTQIAVLAILFARPDISLSQCNSDLLITSGTPTATPSTVARGHTLTLSGWTLKNLYSNTPAGSSFYCAPKLSTNAILEWGDPSVGTEHSVGDMAAGETRTFPASTLTIPADRALGTYWVGILVDAGNQLCETNETNNYVTTQITVVAPCDGADLVVSSGAPSVSPATVAPGGTTTVSSWTVKNQGTAAAGHSFMNGYYLSTDALITASDTHLDWTNNSDLASGAVYTFPAKSVTIPTGTPAGTYYLGILLDYGSEICETTETNNYVSIPITIGSSSCTTSDLVVSSGTPTATPATVTAGYALTLSAWTVKNQGSGSTGAGFTNGFYLSIDNAITAADTLLTSNTNSAALAAGASYNWTQQNLTIPASTAAGTYYVGILVDRSNAICETSESNNYVSTPITVKGTTGCSADLVISSGAPGATPSSVAAGAKVTLSNSVIKNQGSASTVSAFSVGFFLSADAAITTSDTFLLSHNSPALNAGAIINTANVNLTIPSATVAGKYYVGVLADRMNAICETNESNNYASTQITVTGGCTTPPAPSVQAPPQVLSASPYTVSWTAIGGASAYEIGEATKPDFSDAVVKSLTPTSQQYAHTVTAATRFYYRVRATASCNGSVGPYSAAQSVVVALPPSGTDLDPNAAAPAGSTRPIVFKYVLKPPASKNALDASFTAKTDKTWLSVTPAAGTIPPSGTTLTVTASPGSLAAGTNTGTLIVTSAAGSTLASAPMSVTLVNPVTSSEKLAPQSNALFIPVVGYAKGSQSSLFVSDIRITNTSSQSIDYALIFRPSGTNGNENGKQSTITIPSHKTRAINDVVRMFFGLGATGESALGSLEIRPLNFNGKNEDASVATLATLGASRTYNLTPDGTFGQFIPAIPNADFIRKATAGHPNRISLQQIAQSAMFRTNFGIVEGSGNSATALVTVYSSAGVKLGQKSMPLLPYEHQQWNTLLKTMGITSLADGRIEVEVTSDKGSVSAYASVVDNGTNDPLLVFPIVPADIHARRWVVPGVADLNTGSASWRTDMRIYNGGLAAVAAVVTFQQSRKDGKLPKPVAKNVTLQPGKIVAYDSILQSLFGARDVSGLVYITTTVDSSLVVTARTYDKQTTGTYGQFVPAVLPEETVGLGDRELQILQLEQSSRYRTNLGIAESAGSPVMVEIKALAPDSTIVPRKEQYLDANEFIQLNRVLESLQLPTVYNARISVRVISGNGRLTAYGSVVDAKTNDPTYVPAQ